MEQINIEDALKEKDVIFVDCRSPREYEEDHIYHAINLPIFENCERHEVGLLYKQDKDKAMNLGIEYYAKKLPKLVELLKKIDKDKKIIAYCARGGMRSKTICQLADLLGYKVRQLEEGYKGYRNYILNEFENYKPKYKFVVLWGNTGTAKTKLLKFLQPSIDIEDMAKHRSSVFGELGLEKRSQKAFETHLFFNLDKLKNEKFIFIEGESRKIGDVITPLKIFEHIKNGIKINVIGSIPVRVKTTMEEYLREEYVDDIIKIIPSLKQIIGNENVQLLLDLMKKKEYEKITEILLTKYYDPRYQHTINKIKFDYTVNSDDFQNCLNELKTIFNKLS